ncbi:MAG: peptide ABC transporter substrate-binding protein [Leptospiraceae bacterium]|nr:peptide ABC transporter substrate-binding protein [Leptospiraceae bacterium]MDW8307045.1 ABC transporter substrate binding protein [Leptospiraceae bacterium]
MMLPFVFFFLLSYPLVAKINIFVSSDSSIYEEALTGFQAAVEEPTQIYYLDLIEEQQGNVSDFLKNLSFAEGEVVVTLGFRATRELKPLVQKGILLFSMVSSPKNLGLEGGRICGVSMDLPIGEFFSLLREINPRYRQVVSFYTTAGEAQVMEGAYLDLPYKLLYKPVKVNDPREFGRILEKEAAQAHAILMLADPLYTEENFRLLSNYALQNQKVLMTSFRSLVDLGATLALTPNYNRLGMLTGELYRRIKANPAACEEELVILPDEYALYLNENYAKLQGIELPQSLILRGRNTRLFQAALQLFRQEKYPQARKVFEMILEKDPQNKPALFYLEVVIERLTGNRTRQLLAQARQYMDEKKYALARLKYQEALQLNPKNQEAREGLKEATLAHSEEFRLQAIEKSRQGKVFDAIRAYLESLKVLPTNQKARQELSQLRSLEARKIPAYLADANEAYNERDYEKAMELYDNILLIDPNHKEAGEYLRLSRQKYEAAERLLRKQKAGGM